jgi:hypothetical protein
MTTLTNETIVILIIIATLCLLIYVAVYDSRYEDEEGFYGGYYGYGLRRYPYYGYGGWYSNLFYPSWYGSLWY